MLGWLSDLDSGNPGVRGPALHTDPEQKPGRVCLGPSQLRHRPDPPPEDRTSWDGAGGRVLPADPHPCPRPELRAHPLAAPRPHPSHPVRTWSPAPGRLEA